MPRLKVCGITDAEFAAGAAKRGVDYLGFIFAEGSPRRVTPEQARSLAETAASASPSRPPRFVGVFTTHRADEIAAIADSVGLDVVQLHGDYSDADVVALKASGREVWRLYSGEGGPAVEDAVLIDGRNGTSRGGTGRLADWSLVATIRRDGRRVVLAGGISAANVAAAAATGADVIDVNSAIETAPGKKSLGLLDEVLSALGLQQ